MRKAFTLVEVLTSIVLLGIIFTYMYSTINSVKQQNNHYIEKSEIIDDETKIFELLNYDIAQAISTVSIIPGDKFDTINFQTKNSLYQIIQPHVSYFVSKKDFSLIRVESPNGFNVHNQEQKDAFVKTFLYADIVTSECISLKALNTNGLVEILFRTKNLKPMLFTIPTTNG